MVVLNNLLNDARVQKEAKSLTHNGYDVVVIGIHTDKLASKEQIDGYDVIRIRLRSTKWKFRVLIQLIRYLEFTLRSAITMAKYKPHVCHAHAIQALPACWLVAKLVHSKLVYDAHEFEQGRDFSTAARIPWFMQKFWTTPELLFIRSADAVITVSDTIAQALVTSYQIQSPIVIRNAPENFKLPGPTTYLYDRYSLPSDLPIVLYQGKVNEGRGLRELISSAKMVKNVAFVIAGDGPLIDDLKNAAEENGDQTNVIFTGHIPLEILPVVTASGTIGVVLTQNTCLNHFYSLPNKIFEYLQAGIPVIGSDMPEISRVIRNFQVGEVIEHISAENIANTIHLILSNPDRYTNLKNNALNAGRKLTWEIEGVKLLNLYKKMVL
ncbi:MAG: glycosyltransferase family 4 protein [Anaerolineales bacterium]|nr:MAG: glycosyltransferase family 4 protein [Anaerolineales bacterium]